MIFLIKKIIRKTKIFIGFFDKENNYISGDNFRKLSDIHIMTYGELLKFLDSFLVNDYNGKLIFMNADLLEYRELLSNLNSLSWILHDSDRHIGPNDVDWIIKQKFVFSSNNNIIIDNLLPLPLGIENLHYFVNGIPLEYDLLRSIIPKNKKTGILFSFNIITNSPVRQEAYNRIVNHKHSYESMVRGHKYRRLISQYKYSLCPEGNCIDTHRLWESLYLNTIPIVIYTPMFKYYYKLGIPLLILYSWSDLADLNLDNLNFFYDEHKEWFKNKPLFFNFWKETIQSKIHF